MEETLMDPSSAARLRPVGLKPSSANDGLGFRQFLQKQFFGPVLLLGMVDLIRAMIALPRTLNLLNTGTPIMWGHCDPRAIYVAANFVMLLVAPVMIICTWLSQVCKPAHGVQSELLYISYAVCIILSTCLMTAQHSSAICGEDISDFYAPAASAELECLVGAASALFIVMWVCVFFPIRPCFSWIVPTLASASYARLTWMPPYNDFVIFRSLPLFCIMCFFAFCGSCCQVRCIRASWLVNLKLQEQVKQLENRDLVAQAWQSVTSTMSDITIQLSHNLQVVHSDKTHSAYFGHSMLDQMFLPMLAARDRASFTNVLEQTVCTNTLESMPATLELPLRSVEVQLYCVYTNAALPKFVVGICEGGHQVAKETLEENSVLAEAELWPIAEEDHQVAGVRHADQDDEHLLSRAAWWPVADEHEDGIAFNISSYGCGGGLFQAEDVEPSELRQQGTPTDDFITWGSEKSKSLHVHTKLEQLMDVGRKENWLVTTSDLELLPDQVLGSGSFGVLVAGRMRGTPVAVKITSHGDDFSGEQHRKEMRSGNVSLSGLLSELGVLRQIRHPNIVLLCGACVDSGELALVYEWIHGLPLDMFIRDHVVPQDVRIQQRLIQDICCPLRYLHENEPTIVHGDLKCSNILVERKAVGPSVKLLDCGLSQLLMRQAKHVGCTPSWVAPEILDDPCRRPLPSADVFSFGLILQLVFTGVKQSAVPKGGQAFVAHLQDLWPLRTPYTQRARKLCQECLCHNPRLRPSMEVIHKYLFECSTSDCETLQDLALSVQGMSWHTAMAAFRRPEQFAFSAVDYWCCQSDDPLQRKARPFCVKRFKPTPRRAKVISVLQAVFGWNSHFSSDDCCTYHAVLRDLEGVLRHLSAESCSWVDYNSKFQCSYCGTLCTDDQSSASVCPTCKYCERR